MEDNTPKRFDWSTVQSAEVLEESRAYRFPPEWRPLLMQYLGLAPGMHVLEVGCGPGTLAPYLAEAIAPGRVTGVDLDEDFIARAREKAARAGVTNVEYVVADAYHLPFPDDTFDAVTSYTTLGVLEDPEKALEEMIRVCRPGGTVSVAEGVTGPHGISFEGVDYLGLPCYGQERRYWELSQKVRRLVLEHLLPRQGLGSSRWPVRSFFALLSRAGLEGVRMHAWGTAGRPTTPGCPRRRGYVSVNTSTGLHGSNWSPCGKAETPKSCFGTDSLRAKSRNWSSCARPASGGVWNTPCTTGRRACQ